MERNDEAIAAIKALGDSQKELLGVTRELREAMNKANGEIDVAKSMSVETKSAIEKLTDKANELTDRCLALESKATAQPEGGAPQESIGEMFVKSDAWKALQQKRSGSAMVEIKTAIVNATGQNQPLVPAQRLGGIVYEPERRLTIRDLLPVGTTQSNMVEFAKENTFTNNAGPQYASPDFENVTKPESGITFTLDNEPVRTLAHWIPVSRQILDDAPMLQSYINTRLLYGLKLEEEDQILNGDGTGANLSGLTDSGNYAAYSRAVTGDTNLDTLRRAITQAQLANYPVDAIVVNPADWEAIELLKATDNQYIMANPASMAGPTIWGRAVVATNSMASGYFLVGAFSMGAQIWDRMQANVKVSFENSDNFVKNMATILCEERLALTVYRPNAFIYGAF